MTLDLQIAYRSDNDLCCELTCAPLLKFVNTSTKKSKEIQSYIEEKIREINNAEIRIYTQIMDILHYDYHYKYKYILSYSDYYAIINTATNFNKQDKRRIKPFLYWGDPMKKKIEITTLSIQLLLNELEQERTYKMRNIYDYSIKHKIRINSKFNKS